MAEIQNPKSGWRMMRRILITLAVLATLIAIFYTEEDWRGKRVWENCKQELEAQGAVLDWNKFIPPSVRDDQNFYTASSNILLKFKEVPGDDGFYSETKKSHQLQWLNLNPIKSKGVPLFPAFDTSSNPPPIVAEIIVSSAALQVLVSPAVNPPQNTNILAVALGDSAAPGQVRDLLCATVGQSIDGAEGFEFSERPLTGIQPAQIFVRAQTSPSEDDLAGLIPSDTLAKIGRLQVVSTADPNTFRILLTPGRITAAADYLKWSDQFVPAFDEIREALKRPYAVLPGDYSEVYLMPIPNFVTMRSLAQTLAQRAQCDFLLGKPDQALHEMSLVHDVCRILEKPPTGQPETLVEAMVNVAIHGLYTQVIAEGLRRHAWQEPQLIALQQQLAEINLPVPVVRAFKAESAGTTHTLETTPLRKLTMWFSVLASGTRKASLWQNLTDGKWVLPLKMWLIPRGWIYQNMAAIGSFKWSDGFDSENETILPAKIEENASAIGTMKSHPPLPYNFMATVAVPNFIRAWQTTAYNQTEANEGQIACALERYRLAHGGYPETLDALIPQFMQTIPHDIIGGQPLHYHCTNDGKFLLYSVGWNGIDDGGQESPGIQGHGMNFAEGDWVWPVTAK
jgi:hypothetical protein